MGKKRRIRRKPAGRCPCGRRARYRDCCGKFHREEALPEDPVELMRSRYAAYAKGEVDYIVATTDPDGEAWQVPESKWRKEIGQFGHEATFLGVDIIDSGTQGDCGWVRFHARLRNAAGVDASFTERSEFVRRDGAWRYSRGEVESPD